MADENNEVCWGNVKWQMVLLPVLALTQLVMNCVALALPQYIVGNITASDAALYAQDPSDLLKLTASTQASYVQVNIGLFNGFINGFFDGSNREGLVAVFGFALLSTISALFTFFYAVQVCFKCCSDNSCEKCWIQTSVELASFARANFSSGVSDAAVAGMLAFTAEDIRGNTFGSSFYLTIASSLVALINNFLKDRVNVHVRREASDHDINFDYVI